MASAVSTVNSLLNQFESVNNTIVNGLATGADVTLKNLIITGGNAQTGNLSDSHEGRGGGIVVDIVVGVVGEATKSSPPDSTPRSCRIARA